MDWMCTLAPENVIYFKLGGFALLIIFAIGISTGRAIFRSRRVCKQEQPASYWFMQIMYVLLACWALYPVFLCQSLA